jgi:dynein heavy chain
MYNRADLAIQNRITDCMFVACMNPKSGSFFVDTRLTRHLTSVCLSVPEKEILSTIYSQLLTNHFSTFDEKAQKMVPRIIAATQTVFSDMSKNPKFAPTAKKFFYQFNMRDFGKIVQNIMNTQSKDYRNKETEITRLWVHECHRVWRDRLVNKEDLEQYAKTMDTAMKGAGLNGETEAKVIFAEPLIYTSFVDACKGHDPSYRAIRDIEELSQVLHGQLEAYNENVAVMDLVLFNEAMEHITRCCRIVDQPNGHCLLVGVGGSGKQSLSKLSAYILGIEVFRIVVSSSYGMNDLKEDVKAVYMKAGAQGNPQMFILTDTQIISDKFLMYINDILSVGYIAELFAQDEVEEINGRVRSEARANQVEDTPSALFGFFLDKCRKNLHLNLCFSPVGDAFRVRSRMFPGLLNATTMDYHHAWPQDALIGVAARFLEDVELDNEELRTALSEHMAFCHMSIDEANA